MEEEEKPKRGAGRPRIESYINPEWKNIILEAGRNGKHITQFLIELGLSFQSHRNLLNRSKEYRLIFDEYQKLCEHWWYERMYESVLNGESNKFNQRLWTIIMKNKFKENWNDEKQIDITSMGEKLNTDNKINIEIIKSKLEDEGNDIL
jgi:hypothetical protein